jgi:hypothetical protein
MEETTRNTIERLFGKKYTFEDGDSIEVVQVKSRGPEAEDQLVTYHIQQGPGIPRKLVMVLPTFVATYGHLFGLEEPPTL